MLGNREMKGSNKILNEKCMTDISCSLSANYHEMHFTFNLSSLIGGEHILEAEFHLFKMRPRSVQDNEQHSRVRRMQSHVVDVSLYKDQN